MPGLFKPSPPMVLLHLRSIPPPRGVAVERILTDNGKNYTSRAFRETAADHGIRLKRTRPYRPQTNGKAEAFNKEGLLNALHYSCSAASLYGGARRLALRPCLDWTENLI